MYPIIVRNLNIIMPMSGQKNSHRSAEICLICNPIYLVPLGVNSEKGLNADYPLKYCITELNLINFLYIFYYKYIVE